MKFKGTILGSETTDPKAWPALVKANPVTVKSRRGGRGPNRAEMVDVKVKMGVQADQQSGVKPRPQRVTLTDAEREWLGATVRRSDGIEGQVWALAPERGYVWVVADGDFWFAVHTDALEMVQSRVDQLALDL